MRSLRTIAPLTLGLAVLAVAGCQRPADQPVPAAPPPATASPQHGMPFGTHKSSR